MVLARSHTWRVSLEPDVSLITNISESHLSGIGSKDDVFIEKSALSKGNADLPVL